MKTLVIHLSDPTTEELSLIYEGCEALGDIERISDYIPTDEMNKKIDESDTVIMLGHGGPHGLLNVKFNGKAHIINKDNVPHLRGKNIIAVWCYAREFAEANHLEGFFSSMWISEKSEASWCGIKGFTQEYIRKQCGVLSERIKGLLNEGVSISSFADRLKAMDEEKNELTNFNYGGLASFDKDTDWLAIEQQNRAMILEEQDYDTDAELPNIPF